MSRPKPTRAELLAAAGTPVPDLLAPNLRVLFCGINPGLYSAVTLHHFARPGNRFWPTLHAAGFTPRLLRPHEERLLLDWGYGITNLVERSSATADDLSPEELLAGGRALEEKVQEFRPRSVAVLGISAYRAAFRRPKAMVGRQGEELAGALLWVLPNPSGLNAHYNLPELARAYGELREAIEAEND
jgi:TDG/mug DNA glycosylase family protein